LLWIQQGAGQDIHDPVAHATDHLRNALNTSLDEVASSGGDDVLATVETQRNELLTPAGGAPSGALSEALKRQAQLEAELKAADTDVFTYRHKVDSLGGLRREQAADEAERPWAGFRKQEHDARGKLEAIERVQNLLAAERQRAEQLDAQVKLLRGRLEAFAEQEAAAKTRGAAVQGRSRQRPLQRIWWPSGRPRPALRNLPMKPQEACCAGCVSTTPAPAWLANSTS
jgi:hypothetical protein